MKWLLVGPSCSGKTTLQSLLELAGMNCCHYDTAALLIHGVSPVNQKEIDMYRPDIVVILRPRNSEIIRRAKARYWRCKTEKRKKVMNTYTDDWLDEHYDELFKTYPDAHIFDGRRIK